MGSSGSSSSNASHASYASQASQASQTAHPGIPVQNPPSTVGPAIMPPLPPAQPTTPLSTLASSASSAVNSLQALMTMFLQHPTIANAHSFNPSGPGMMPLSQFITLNYANHMHGLEEASPLPEVSARYSNLVFLLNHRNVDLSRLKETKQKGKAQRNIRSLVSVTSPWERGQLLSHYNHLNVLPCNFRIVETPENEAILLQMLRPTPQPFRSHYWNMRVSDLRALIRKRGLKVVGRKVDLVAILETGQNRGNNDGGFRIMDLPLEIRIIIYKFALTETKPDDEGGESDVPGGLLTTIEPQLCWQPPLLRVSKEMRDETLGVFYSANRFALRMRVMDGRARPGRFNSASKYAATVMLDPRSRKFLRSVARSGGLRSLTKLAIELVVSTRMIVVNIDLAPKKSEEHLTIMRTCSYHGHGSNNCRRWPRVRKMHEVFKTRWGPEINADMNNQDKKDGNSKEAGSDIHKELDEALIDLFSALEDSVDMESEKGKGAVHLFEELAITVGEVLYEKRNRVP